ncbi:ATP-binding protein [Anaerolineales bacterium HSG6]|nr:ATP-binding protein [Anaerolineales bacterium HSG6]
MTKLCIQMCGFFKREIEAIIKSEGWDDVVVSTFPAKCGRPPTTWDTLELANSRQDNLGQVNIFGSRCIIQLTDAPAELEHYHIHKIQQCFHLFASRAIIDSYIRSGAYLITPGWLARWKRQLDEWQFDRELGREFFRESASRLLLLDTGVDEKSFQRIQEFSEFVALPYEIIPIGLDYLKLTLTEIVLQWRLTQEQKKTETTLSDKNRQLSEHTMTFDLMSSFSSMKTEEEVIEGMLELFTMLCAPGELSYLPLREERLGRIRRSWSSPPADEVTVQKRLASLTNEHVWTESGQGFRLRIGQQGILEVEQIAFPEYKEYYLNLALSIAGVCDLAIANARQYQLITEQRNQLVETLKDLQETQQQLIESEKMAALGGLVAGVAHEINTPVGTSITASSNLLGKTKKFVEIFKTNNMRRQDLQQYLQITYDTSQLILSNLYRTDELVKSFKRVSVDQISEHRSNFQLKSSLKDILVSLKPKLQEGPTKIDVKLECDEIIELTSFPGALAQIITNLIVNSQTHGFQNQAQGQIKIVAKTDNDQLILTYQDNGKGISEDTLPKIFDPFFTSDKQIGTGLGLHIVYNIVTQKLGGSIHCESELGKGVLFVVVLPLNIGERHEQ